MNIIKLFFFNSAPLSGLAGGTCPDVDGARP